MRNSHLGPKLRDHLHDHRPLTSTAIVESEAENAHFQPSAWGFLTTKHSPRFANDVALVLREKSRLGWIVEAQTASELTTVEILVCRLDFVLEH